VADAVEVELHGIPGGFTFLLIHLFRRDLHWLGPMTMTLVHDWLPLTAFSFLLLRGGIDPGNKRVPPR